VLARHHSNCWMGRYQSLEVGGWAVFGRFYNSIFFVIFCKPVNAAERISLRASCFDGGTSNVRVELTF
jgi:hypothetical protein